MYAKTKIERYLGYSIIFLIGVAFFSPSKEYVMWFLLGATVAISFYFGRQSLRKVVNKDIERALEKHCMQMIQCQRTGNEDPVHFDLVYESLAPVVKTFIDKDYLEHVINRSDSITSEGYKEYILVFR